MAERLGCEFSTWCRLIRNIKDVRAKARFSRLTNGCAWNAVSAFANCGGAVAFVRSTYVPRGDLAPPGPLPRRGSRNWQDIAHVPGERRAKVLGIARHGTPFVPLDYITVS